MSPGRPPPRGARLYARARRRRRRFRSPLTPPARPPSPPRLHRWCHHCKSLKPEWERAASALRGIVGVAALDADAHPGAAAQHGINVEGFPTIKLVHSSGGKLVTSDYGGGRSASELVKWATAQAQKLALARLGAGAGGGAKGGAKGGARGSGSAGSGSANAGSGFYAGTPVVELSDADFHARVTDSEELWLVEFYAPWCGESSCVLGRPVEAENMLETNQPTDRPLIADHCPK